MSEAATEPLAGNTAQQRLGLYRTELVSRRLKIRIPETEWRPQSESISFCLDELRCPVSESYLSPLLTCLRCSAPVVREPSGEFRLTAAFPCWNDV